VQAGSISGQRQAMAKQGVFFFIFLISFSPVIFFYFLERSQINLGELPYLIVSYYPPNAECRKKSKNKKKMGERVVLGGEIREG
jgi:hypothetical protein